MPHDHGHPHADFGRAFACAAAINTAYVLVEAGVGVAVGSLALLSDAGHNLSDVLALLIAWGANTLGRVRASGRFTYGLGGASIWAAVVNAMLLLVAVGAISWEAVGRFGQPVAVPPWPVVWVALIGVGVNTATALLFLKGQHDLNVRGAYLHMVADAAVSVGVVLAGLLIAWTGRAWIDPAVSLLVAAVILWGTWSLLAESVRLSMLAAPAGVDLDAVRAYLASRPGVTAVHDLHVWALSTTQTALSAHLVRPSGGGDDAFLAETAHGLDHQFGIDHPTIQLERDAAACRAKWHN